MWTDRKVGRESLQALGIVDNEAEIWPPNTIQRQGYVTPRLGGERFIFVETDSIANPEVFNEFFTGTDSWVFTPQTYTLPSAGPQYVVAFAPSGQIGKMWLPLGRKESFTAADIRSMPETIAFVRKFHEVGPVGGLGFWISLPIWVIRWIFGI